MQAILHIGTEKTGTTTVQSFLALNRKTLRDAGILVPVSLGAANHRLLPAMVNDADVIDDLFRQRGLLETDARQKAKAEWRRKFIAEVTRAGLPRCVISSEHLQSRLRRKEEIERLRDLLAELFDSVRLVLYIRHPAATAVSLHSTAVKYGAGGANPPPPSNDYFRNIVDHAATIRLWGSVFGENSLTVRIFARDCFVNGSLIDDFAAACGLPPLDYKSPKVENESLSALGLEVLRRVNEKIPLLATDGTVNRQREGLVGFFERHFSTGARYVPPKETVEKYETEFAASNEWVRRTCFPERETLFQPYVFPDTVTPHWPDEDVQGLADAFVELWQQRDPARRPGTRQR